MMYKLLFVCALFLSACGAQPRFGTYAASPCNAVVREMTEVRELAVVNDRDPEPGNRYEAPPLSVDTFEQGMERAEYDLAAQAECEGHLLEQTSD